MPGTKQDEQGQGRVYRRVVDLKGRVTLPVEMRQQLGIRTGEEVEFVVKEEGEWYLRKPPEQKSCAMCGAAAHLFILGNQALCQPCALEYVQRLARELGLSVVGKGGNFSKK
ncbi:MAG TPA: hypothetical protein DEA73_02255 [Peptococcaceae bacterium]|nr:MAG: hypothetical protein XD51_1043 [Moorella sp. 60_41]HBT46693.1 hypothetical protein [Peptococcaceae bacterium]